MTAGSRRRGAVRLMAVAAVAVACASAACGVPSDRHARAIGDDELPAALRQAPLETTTTTEASPSREVHVVVFFAKQDRLAPVGRTLPTPVSLADRLEALLRGPTQEDAAGGLRSAVAPETALLGVDVAGGVAEIDVSHQFVDLAGQEQIVAVAEVVFTATETPGIHGVRFKLGGERVPVPTGDGTLTDAPLTRDDYASLRPL